MAVPEVPSQILRIALPVAVPRCFDYGVPEGWRDSLLPGMRVQVPFGTKTRVGLILGTGAGSPLPPDRIKSILGRIDDQPILRAQDLDFIRWAADYYGYPLGQALFSALPPPFRQPKPLPPLDLPGFRLTDLGKQADPAQLGRAKKQREILIYLQRSPQGVSRAALQAALGSCDASLRNLKQRGWVESCRISAPFPARPTKEAPFSLHPDQQRAIQAVQASFGRFQAFLLEGVTGSGKTEVYIRLLISLIAAGKQALLLVPEIGLTPQLERRLTERIGGRLAVLHSGLSSGARLRAWQQAARGEADVVLGTRSAVFTPLPRLGLILVDEEQDLSFKQREGFPYSARDLAVLRARRTGCPVVLGSATPALETLHNAQQGRYRWLRLPRRAGNAQIPPMHLIDIRNQPLCGGLSPALIEAMRQQFAQGGQVLLLLNRRGYAPAFCCHQCGWIHTCPHCGVQLVVHRSDHRLRCHHCSFSQPLPKRCSNCGGLDLRPLGQGTERLEENLRVLFPDLPMARVDRDSTQRKGHLHQLLADARAGRYPLLLGTQMLAKGHHFPQVTLVGILGVDNSLYSLDFRAPERMAQLILQMAGRAGRAQRPGKVLLQTRHPDHPLLQILQRGSYAEFAEKALAERREAGLPPYSFQALLSAEARKPETAQAYLEQAMQRMENLDAAGILVLGPVPAPRERRAGRYRAQLLLQAQHRPQLQAFLRAWVPALYSIQMRVRWSLDVDPLEMD